MPLFEPILPRRYLAPFLRALDSVPPALAARALHAAALDPESSVQPDAVVPLEKVENLIETVVAHPAHGDFGFEAGMRLALEDHGPLTPVLSGAPTIGARVRLQTQFARLITPIFSWHFSLLSEGAELLVRPAAPFRPQSLRVFMELYATAHAHNIGALLNDPRAPLRIHLPFEAPAHAARYRDLPNVRFRFSPTRLPEIRLFYPEEVLATRLNPEADTGGAVDRRSLDRLQYGLARTDRIGEWTRLILMEAEACQPSLDEMASLLNMSRRSFERALAAESLGFRELSKRVRYGRACTMLRDPGISVAQIAYRLGYVDQSSFNHAFKAIAGCSPGRYRRGLPGGSPPSSRPG